MEGLTTSAPVIDLVSAVTPDSPFVLVDIGCSGGINPLWRSFGSRLRALGIDPSLAEVERLTSAETHPGVRYLSALAGLPSDHAFARQKQGRGWFSRIPWNRLSTARSLEILKSARELSSSEKAAANLWDSTKQSNDVVVVPDYLRENGMSSVDFVKIDVDGADFDILHSFDSALDELGILGLGIEVNYFGSDMETDHTFHNVDRFMKARGFELFGLTVRRYSVAALPARYVWHLPSATEFGRPLQGDAFYARDLASGDYDAFAARMSAEKLLNLVCLFAAANLPDCAAEVALRFRSRLDAYDVDRILDALAAQAQGRSAQPLSYREYLDRFEAHDDMFFAPEPGSAPPIPNATVVPLPNLFDIRSRDTTGESTVVAEDPFELITPARQWSYAVSMVTRQDLSAEDPSACVVISASVLVRSGCLGVGWLFHDRDEFLFERYLDEGTNRTIVLRVPVTAVPGRLMFRNAGATGPSRFVLRDVHARLETAPLYGVSVEPRVWESDTGTAGAASGAFDDGEAITINAARLGFLSRLGIPLTRKRVLDAGCGVGHHTPFYLARGCTVVGIDGRTENIARMKDLYPEVEGLVGNVQDMDLERLGTFDIVHCLGLLYHLDSPIAALRRLASVCREVLILETLVCDAKQPVMLLADEPGIVNQALGGIGCRPSPSFVAMALNRLGFPHVYGTADPPRHPDFRFDWLDTLDVERDGHNLRCMFVASRSPIQRPHLVELISTD